MFIWILKLILAKTKKKERKNKLSNFNTLNVLITRVTAVYCKNQADELNLLLFFAKSH